MSFWKEHVHVLSISWKKMLLVYPVPASPVWLWGCHERQCRLPAVWSALPSSSKLAILQQAGVLVRCPLPLVNPRYLFPVTFLSIWTEWFAPSSSHGLRLVCSYPGLPPPPLLKLDVMFAFLPVVRNLPQAYGLLKTCRVWSLWHWPAPSGLRVASQLHRVVCFCLLQVLPNSIFFWRSFFILHSSRLCYQAQGCGRLECRPYKWKLEQNRHQACQPFPCPVWKAEGSVYSGAKEKKQVEKMNQTLIFGTTKNNKFQVEIYGFSVCPSLLCIVNNKLFILSSKLVELILNAIHRQVLSIGVHFTSLCCCINPF